MRRRDVLINLLGDEPCKKIAAGHVDEPSMGTDHAQGEVSSPQKVCFLMTQPQGIGEMSGRVLEGAYRITRLIGEGGMGAVYEGVQLRLNKRVAIKLMSRDLTANREALARFRREAEITSHLGHPHLVNVMDFGTSDAGEPYLVMEYLDGEDLDHRIRRDGRLFLETAVAITRQVASALAAAHDEGIVHRDLKPANVFLVKVKGEADFVKVLDFGVSKIKASRTKLTRATAIVGTPEYMSPEQATGLIEEWPHKRPTSATTPAASTMVRKSPEVVTLPDGVSATSAPATNSEFSSARTSKSARKPSPYHGADNLAW